MLVRLALVVTLATAVSCQGSTAPPAVVEVVLAPPTGDAAAWIAAQRSAARDTVVYVGAAWCEPCRHFHEAVAAHQLDARFPRLRLLEFDFDRDEERLLAAGYTMEMLPAFALPGSDGRAVAEISGSIKGPGAVDEIAPRLARLIAAGAD